MKANTVSGILFILFGMMAVSFPFITSVGVELFWGALFLAAGIFHIMSVFAANDAAEGLLSLLGGMFFTAFGLVLMQNPVVGSVTLTGVMATFFIVQGIATMIFSFGMRDAGNWGFVFLNGLVALVLGALVSAQWPVSGLWVVGLYIGVNMVMFGFSQIMGEPKRAMQTA